MSLSIARCVLAGDFFKSHIDTPRAANMFGSLIVTLPAAHAGGALVLRHGGAVTKSFSEPGVVEGRLQASRTPCPAPSHTHTSQPAHLLPELAPPSCLWRRSW